jgi:hypothetical protein
VASLGGCCRKKRDGVSHGPTARRGDAQGGGCTSRAWSGCGGWSASSARGGGRGCAAVMRARRQRSGAVEAAPETDKWAPAIFLFNKIFRHPHFDIRKGDLSDT